MKNAINVFIFFIYLASISVGDTSIQIGSAAYRAPICMPTVNIEPTKEQVKGIDFNRVLPNTLPFSGVIAVDASSGVGSLYVDDPSNTLYEMKQSPKGSHFEALKCRFLANTVLFITHIHRGDDGAVAEDQNNVAADEGAVVAEGFPNDEMATNQTVADDGANSSSNGYASGYEEGNSTAADLPKGEGSVINPEEAEADAGAIGSKNIEDFPVATMITIQQCVVSAGAGITISGLSVSNEDDGEKHRHDTKSLDESLSPTSLPVASGAVVPIHVDIHGNVFLEGAAVIVSGSLPAHSSIRIRGNKFILGGKFVSELSFLDSAPTSGIRALMHEVLVRHYQFHSMTPAIVLKTESADASNDLIAKNILKLISDNSDKKGFASHAHRHTPSATLGTGAMLAFTKNHFVAKPVTIDSQPKPLGSPFKNLMLDSPCSAIISDVGTSYSLRSTASIRVIYNYVVDVVAQHTFPIQSDTLLGFQYTIDGIGPLEYYELPQLKTTTMSSSAKGQQNAAPVHPPPAFVQAERWLMGDTVPPQVSGDAEKQDNIIGASTLALPLLLLNGASLTIVAEGVDTLFQFDSNRADISHGMGWWAPRILIGNPHTPKSSNPGNADSVSRVPAQQSTISVTFFRNIVDVRGAPVYPTLMKASPIAVTGAVVAFGDILLAPSKPANTHQRQNNGGGAALDSQRGSTTTTATVPDKIIKSYQGANSVSTLRPLIQPSFLDISFNKIFVRGLVSGSSHTSACSETIRMAFFGSIHIARSNYLTIATNKIYTAPSLSPQINIVMTSLASATAASFGDMIIASPADGQIAFYGSYIYVSGAGKLTIKSNEMRKLAHSLPIKPSSVSPQPSEEVLLFQPKASNVPQNAAAVAYASSAVNAPSPLIAMTSRIMFAGRSTLVITDNFVVWVSHQTHREDTKNSPDASTSRPFGCSQLPLGSHCIPQFMLLSLNTDYGGSFALSYSAGFTICGNGMRVVQVVGVARPSLLTLSNNKGIVGASSALVLKPILTAHGVLPLVDGLHSISTAEDLLLSVSHEVSSKLVVFLDKKSNKASNEATKSSGELCILSRTSGHRKTQQGVNKNSKAAGQHKISPQPQTAHRIDRTEYYENDFAKDANNQLLDQHGDHHLPPDLVHQDLNDMPEFHHDGIDDGADLKDGNVDLDDWGPENVNIDDNDNNKNEAPEVRQVGSDISSTSFGGIEFSPLVIIIFIMLVIGAAVVMHNRKRTSNKKRAVLSARLKRSEIDF